jgi:hypothetical protein
MKPKNPPLWLHVWDCDDLGFSSGQGPETGTVSDKFLLIKLWTPVQDAHALAHVILRDRSGEPESNSVGRFSFLDIFMLRDTNSRRESYYRCGSCPAIPSLYTLGVFGSASLFVLSCSLCHVVVHSHNVSGSIPVMCAIGRREAPHVRRST